MCKQCDRWYKNYAIACTKKNIPALCEWFDGQWANLAFKREDGEPLTLLHLQNKSWEMASHLS